MTKRLTLIALSLSLPIALSAQTKMSAILSTYTPIAAAQDGKAVKRGLIENDKPNSIVTYSDEAKTDTTSFVLINYFSSGKESQVVRKNGAGLNLDTKETYTYGGMGTDSFTVKYLTAQQVAGGDFLPSNIDTTIVDKNGYMIYSTDYDYISGAWIVNSRSKTQVTYYPNGKYQEMLDMEFDTLTGGLSPVSKIEFTLDGSGEYSSAIISQYDPASKDYTEQAKMTNLKLYNNNFETPESVDLAYSIGGLYIDALKIRITYSPEGWMKSSIYSANNGTEFKVNQAQYYTYDAYGNQTESLSLNDMNGDATLDTMITTTKFKYDQQTRVTESATYNYDNLSKVTEFSEVSVYMYTKTSVQSQKSVLNLGAYPNPATETVNLNFGKEAGLATINITDLSGRIVDTKQFRVVSGQNVQLEVSAYPAGMYIMSAILNSNIYNTRLVKR